MRLLNNRKRWSSIALLLATTLIMAACGNATTPASTPEVGTTPTTGGNTPGANPTSVLVPDAQATTGAGPKATGKLVLYTSRTESLIKPVIDAFTKANPGTDIVLLTGGNGDLGAKLLEERNRPQADVFINTDTLNMASLASEGVFAPNRSKGVTSVPSTYRADDGTWVALTLRARVIMYNTNLVKPEELPKSVFDLTDPKWKGQVGAANSTNGAMQAQIATIRKLLGEQKAEDFIRGLVANDTKFFGGHTDVRKAVGAGELKLGLVNHYYYQLSKAEGAPVGVIYPDQEAGQMGLVVNSTNAGIIKGAPNPELAQAFVDYLLTTDGQKVFADLNYEYPVVPGVALAEGVAKLDQFRQADITLKTMWDELKPAQQLMQKAGLP